MEAVISPILQILMNRRLELGMTQHAVARLAGLTQSYLSAIETGKLDPRLSTLQEIARALRAEFLIAPIETISTIEALLGTRPPTQSRRLYDIDPD